ncbi:MAG: delta-60 repeat domain-containing protein, partial [bacterium]
TTDFDARVGGGIVYTPGYPTDASREVANALAIQPDGKIVAAGRGSGDSGSDFALARYNPDGTLDASFGGDGTLTTDLGGTASDVAHALAIEPGGKIVAAGYSSVGDSADFALARYNPDGTLDTSFGGDGTLTTDFAGGYDESAALALQGDKVVVAGRTQVPSMFPYDPQYNPGDFALARYNPDGTLDASFGGDGTVTTDIGAGSADAATALAVDPEGRLVAGGESTALEIGLPHFALARYNPDGALDPAFGKGGAVTLDIGDDLDYIQALTFHGGKILALGVSVEDLAEFALARFETIDAGAAPAELKVEMTVPPSRRPPGPCSPTRSR